MKLNIATDTFLKNIQLSVQTVDNSNLNPYLSGIIIEAKNNQVILSSSNLNYQSKIIIDQDIEIKEEGSILIKGSLLYNLISKITEKSVQLTTVEDNVVNIATSTGNYNLNLMSVSIYPTLSFDYDGAAELVLPIDFIHKINNKITPCVAVNSNDYNRILNGIHFDSTRNDDLIEVIGTDSFHLAYLSKTIKTPKIEFTILPDALRFIENNAKSTKEIHLFVTKQKLFFLDGKNLFVCKLLDGKYPSLYKAIEGNYSHSLQVDLKNLINTIDLAYVLTINDKRPTIKLLIQKEKMDITTQNIESGSSSQSINIQNNTSTQNIEFILNIKYLLHILKVFTGSTITFNFIDENKPILVTNNDIKDEKYLILPIRM